jgi:hypothetical protein
MSSSQYGLHIFEISYVQFEPNWQIRFQSLSIFQMSVFKCILEADLGTQMYVHIKYKKGKTQVYICLALFYSAHHGQH